jgi:hypothetical protein
MSKRPGPPNNKIVDWNELTAGKMTTSLITIIVEMIDDFEQGPTFCAGFPAGLFFG